MKKPPFFILGCVRSGTTLLRDILRIHPNLECPEETYFFRWGEPFGTDRYNIKCVKNRHIKLHREIDGVSEQEFAGLLRAADSRKTLAEAYAQLYLEKKGKAHARWFDKTPQNIYGILLLKAFFPESKIIHIYRNPLNVVCSLMEGKVMPVHSLKGAVNYWVEAMHIINGYKAGLCQNLLEISYEALTQRPDAVIEKLLLFIGEDPKLLKIPAQYVHKEQNKFKTTLSKEQIAAIIQQCEPYYSQYHYK